MRPILRKLPKPIFPSLCRTTHTAAYYTQPSAAYFDLNRQSEFAVSTTPRDISKEQRESLHNALRIDQAGEIAANWIYKGQLVVLGHDPTVGPLIQVRFYSSGGVSVMKSYSVGNVAPRTKTSYGHGQIASSASRTTYRTK